MATVWRSQTSLFRILHGKTHWILNNSSDVGAAGRHHLAAVPVQRQYSTYSRSPYIYKIEEQYNFEIVKNPPEWKYVERLLPFETIPKVTPKESYPSGWVPPKEEARDLPYFIQRTRNHEIPIYLHLTHKGQRKISIIKKIEGDIWLMNDVVKELLHKINNRYVETRVHEMGKFIEVKGDFVNPLKEWAISRGF